MAPSGVMWLSHVHGRSQLLAAGSILRTAVPLIFRFLSTLYNIHLGRQQQGQSAAAAENFIGVNTLDSASETECMVRGSCRQRQPSEIMIQQQQQQPAGKFAADAAGQQE
jgi:hypothetical protein